ncbi:MULTISPECIES: polyphosphate:AMP phosphotransferase [unclassified Guyparkeria]|uniref:polyphosphate:AMP phosphotransferase n=1 Tax=unclassified Guyparkeria TaxID=2626246 RepID=UPI0007334111|nr:MULTISPECIES: polyphosphate:AMP phosphotransferase [unclassified Guyparkeria]KTG16908.1 polyphosphate kinase 2 [Guyparkeria sp. XI15]OAE85942.1 polyphosphate kinase 2 [Guyparkeria sp. WRN-7]
MFEAAELGRRLSKSDYREAEPELRAQLLEAQRRARAAGLPVLLLITGVAGAGKGELVNRLHEWLDSRNVRTHVFWDETDEEKQRPRWWRYWRAMPAAGEIGILFGGWYAKLLDDARQGQLGEEGIEGELDRIRQIERMLIDDGALLVKFWLHLPASEQARRVEARRRDPKSHWHMAPETAREANHYDEFIDLATRMVRETDTGESPWFLIEATDRHFRDLTAGKTLHRAIDTRLAAGDETATTRVSHAPALPEAETARRTIVDHVDTDLVLAKDEYKREKRALDTTINRLGWKGFEARHPVVAVFEGWDAAGKGGAIRRLTEALDARLYNVIPIAEPSDEEAAHHYLWRFWRQLPRDGYWTIFDRSWYGRVLVERVEGFASQPEWARAYHEINTFEEQLAEHGVTLLKFWLNITPEEQLQRFEARQETPYKQHKITDDDWRNRKKWDDYKAAVNEMVIRTSTEYAPWHIIPANDKRYARIEVMRIAAEAVKRDVKAAKKRKEKG